MDLNNAERTIIPWLEPFGSLDSIVLKTTKSRSLTATIAAQPSDRIALIPTQTGFHPSSGLDIALDSDRQYGKNVTSHKIGITAHYDRDRTVSVKSVTDIIRRYTGKISLWIERNPSTKIAARNLALLTV